MSLGMLDKSSQICLDQFNLELGVFLGIYINICWKLSKMLLKNKDIKTKQSLQKLIEILFVLHLYYCYMDFLKLKFTCNRNLYIY